MNNQMSSGINGKEIRKAVINAISALDLVIESIPAHDIQKRIHISEKINEMQKVLRVIGKESFEIEN